jgi:uncharacterized protein
VFVVLLPPSEGKAEGGDGPPWAPDDGRFADLAPQRERVLTALRRANGGSQKLLGVKGEHLVRAKAANVAAAGAPTLPAWRRFTGVVWDHLVGDGLPAAAQRRAADAVVVITALTGLSAWDDPVPDFRLKLSASPGRLGRVDALWRAPLTERLDAHLEGSTVVDLLPNEHRAAWVPDPERYRLLRPELTLPDGRPAGHWGKAAKGLLTRQLLVTGDVEGTLATFQAPGVILTLGAT